MLYNIIKLFQTKTMSKVEGKVILRKLRDMKSVGSTSMVSLVVPPNTNL